MNTEKINKLLEKYLEGETSLEEEELIRQYFKENDIPAHLQSYRDQFEYFLEMHSVETEKGYDPFQKINFEEEEGQPAPAVVEGMESIHSRIVYDPIKKVNLSQKWLLRIAAGLILLLTGFSAGLLINRPANQTGEDMAALKQEVQQMRTALVYGSYQQTPASKRISAVNLSAKIPENTSGLDREITDILIYTLNNDENINVREAAAEALFRFRDEPRIRKALVSSLPRQDDPLMQLSLINMLVKMKERAAVNEMQRLLMDAGTRQVVKTRLKTGIAELKT